MMEYTIKISGMAAVMAAVDPTILHKPARNLLTRSGEKVKSNARDNILSLKLIDRGGLYDSPAYEVDPSMFPKSVKVGSGLEYARATELGRPAGIMPPVGPLQAWAERKGFTITPRNKPNATPTTEGAGWVLARKIERDGTKPKPFLLPAVTDAEPAIKKYANVFAKEIEAAAAAAGGG